MKNLIRMHGNGTQGQAAARGRAGVELYAGHGGMVAELRGGGKDFRSEAGAGRSQKSEVRNQGEEREELGGTSAQPIARSSRWAA